MHTLSFTAVSTAILAGLAHGQTACSGVPAAKYPYKLAEGWSAVKVADGLKTPRHMAIDKQGRLLVAEQYKGLSQHTIDAATGCITASKSLIDDKQLNHGIYFSPDGLTLYASTSFNVYRWAYDPATGQLGNERTTLVTNMSTSGHTTRTLIVHPSKPNLLVVSVGSDGNFDMPSVDPAVGRAIVKVFDISTVPKGGYIYADDGWSAGHGLRNEVGLSFDKNEELWGVENSGDDLERIINGTTTDIHQNNPAEKLNYLGDISKPNPNWYGYPTCWTVGEPAEIKDASFQIGDQIIQAPNSTFDDSTCAKMVTPPAMTFESHQAPLDSKFDADSKNLYVALHGSWNRDPPQGYKLVAVPFTTQDDGSYRPVADRNMKRGYTDILYPQSEAACSSTTCTRPCGLVWDAAGRLYMTSDTSGEIFLLSKA
ncbi:PI-PLC X domain-containing protein 1 [Apiospora arundinis]|uniref:Carbohydrate-binding cytochrome b562-like protein n=1 Tax=Apiospora arundinis TaxID=335852 RepID=A0ABR2JNM7_9PEZI